MNESGTLRASSGIFLHVDPFWFCSLVALYVFMWLLFHKTSYFQVCGIDCYIWSYCDDCRDILGMRRSLKVLNALVHLLF